MDDRAEFEKNYRRNKSFITSVLRRYIRNPQTVEDLVQQTFMKAWVSRDKFEHRSSYRTWLYRIAVNATFNFLKHEKHQIKIIDGNPSMFEDVNTSPHYMYATPLQSACELEDMEELKEAVQKLPPQMQQTLVMSVFYGMDYQSIADSLGVPIGTVRSRLNRARHILSSGGKD